MKTYGLPYQGSKNKIADAIIQLLPPAETFVDLFAGGCAMTHAAILSGKYKNYIINDTDPLATQLFIDAIEGKYLNNYKWVTREEFHRLKNSDGFVKYCYSFGNNGRRYLYSPENEKLKRAMYAAVVDNDLSGLGECNITATLPDGDTESRRAALKRATKIDIEPLTRLNRVNRLTELQPWRDTITVSCKDYAAVDIPENSVVYCDIPYSNAYGYGDTDFNGTAFLDWAAGRDNLYISEYNISDGRYECIWEKQHASIYSSHSNSTTRTERLYRAKTR